VNVVEASVRGGRCEDPLGPSPFRDAGATHVLVADFYGLGASDRKFADSVTAQVDAELARFRDEVLPQMPVKVPLEAVEFERLRCFVDSHVQAEQVARAWGADLVIWGRAYCNVAPEIQQHITTGSVSAMDSANVVIGRIDVSKPYAVCPSATLYHHAARLHRSADKAIDLGSLAHLDLPTLSSTAPFQLVNFALGLHFYEQREPWIAVRFFERSAADILSPRDENLATLDLYLGRAYMELPGGEDQAIAYDQHALEVVSGTGTATEATLLNNVGAALASQGNYSAAIDYYRRALAINEKTDGKDGASSAPDLNNIGTALASQGNYSDAIDYYRRALTINERAFGVGDSSTAKNLNNIGTALSHLGRQAEAVAYFRRALAIHETTLGKDHPSTATDLGNIGLALLEQADYDGAITCFRRALAIHEAALGEDNPSTAADLNNIGLVFARRGDYDEAFACFQRVLGIDQRAFGERDARTATALNSVGSALLHQNKTAEALDYYRRALEITEKTAGKDHPDTATCLNNVGLALVFLAQYREAIVYYRRALDIHQRSFGNDHPLTAIDLNNIGQALVRQGKPAESLPYLTRALAIDEQALGKDHPDTATDLNNIGEALAKQGKFAAATEKLARSLQVFESRLGAEARQTAAARENLGLVLAEASGRTRAKKGAKGPVVINVLPNSQAEALGLAVGDWIISYGGHPVARSDVLIQLVRENSELGSVVLDIVRKGKHLSLTLKSGPIGLQLAD
jgi:tetratricopeptide (TPR) repeat protein